MVSRRRFLFLLGGAATGLWLASTGLVRLERNFVLKLAGSCSFCGKDRTEVRVLVGTLGRECRICDECLGLCCDILGERDFDTLSYTAPPFEDERFHDELAGILHTLAAEREAARKEMLLDDLRRSFDAAPRTPLREFHCSFCDASRSEVAKLISGPRVFICETCIGDAAGVVAHVLRV